MYSYKDFPSMDAESIASHIYNDDTYKISKNHMLWHIACIRNKAKELCETLWYQNIQEVDTVSILHDIVAIWWLKHHDISMLFWEKIWQDCQSLNQDNNDWHTKSKDQYFSEISEDLTRTIVKVAQRHCDISQLSDTKTIEETLYLLKNYEYELIYFLKYNLLSYVIIDALDQVHISLTKKWWIQDKK